MAKKNKILFTEEDFYNAKGDLLPRVESNKYYTGIVCPLNGGWPLSYFLSMKLKLPIMYMDISSYDKDNNQRQLRYSDDIKPVKVEEGQSWLIADDIYDTGKTIKFIANTYPFLRFDVMTLVSKQASNDIRNELRQEGIYNFYYSKLISPKTWVEFYWEKW